MPKQKTNSGVKKRFKKTGTGKLICIHAEVRHNRRKKTKKQKRHQRGGMIVSKADHPRISKMLSC